MEDRKIVLSLHDHREKLYVELEMTKKYIRAITNLLNFYSENQDCGRDVTAPDDQKKFDNFIDEYSLKEEQSPFTNLSDFFAQLPIQNR